MEITLPNVGWKPRSYQRPAWDYLENGGKRAVSVWHRRSGKDDLALHHTCIQTQLRPATYWYLLPQIEHARKAIWEAVSPHTGMKRINEAFPEALRARTINHTMTIEFKNGSMFHVVGSNNFNSLVGSPPAGIVFSEFSLSDPACWAYLRPILDENGGWALFNFTPRGRNHGWRILQHAINEEQWFGEIVTVDDTNVFTKDQIDESKRELQALYGEGPGEALFLQENYCSFDAAVLGAYYAKELGRADREGRVAVVPHDPSLKVETFWDLGVSHATAVWFIQRTGRTIQAIDYMESTNEGMDYYIREVLRKPYVYARHVAPHDIMVKEYGSGLTRLEQAKKLGIDFKRAPNLPVDDGINAVRAILPRMFFDSKNCARGLDCLRNYTAKYDEHKMKFTDKPVDNWTTDGSDAFRYFAVTPEPHDHEFVDDDPFENHRARSTAGGWMT